LATEEEEAKVALAEANDSASNWQQPVQLAFEDITTTAGSMLWYVMPNSLLTRAVSLCLPAGSWAFICTVCLGD